MRTSVKVLLITAAALVGIGIIGAVVFYAGGAADRYTAYEYCDDYYYGQNGMYNRYSIASDVDEETAAVDSSDEDTYTWQGNGNYNSDDWDGGYYCDPDDSNYGYYSGRGMMGGYYYQSSDESELLSLEALTDNVNDYISGFDEDLVIGDIFVFENSDYYFSIEEENTGLGAFELLVDPYTGYVYPEMGPNMMWNTKYGMHASSEYGMMNGRGMMGGYSYPTEYGSAERNTISYGDALDIAGDYLQNGYTVSGEGHEFYGYYTFHTLLNGEEAGMMSVNGFTGEVWYHTWHGELIEVIGGHDH